MWKIAYIPAKFVKTPLTLIRVGLFGAAHGWREGAKNSPYLKSVTRILQ